MVQEPPVRIYVSGLGSPLHVFLERRAVRLCIKSVKKRIPHTKKISFRHWSFATLRSLWRRYSALGWRVGEYTFMCLLMTS